MGCYSTGQMTVKWQSNDSPSCLDPGVSRLDSSILENFENQVSSRVSRISRIENWVSSRETNELVARVISREVNRTNGPNSITSVINLLLTDPTSFEDQVETVNLHLTGTVVHHRVTPIVSCRYPFYTPGWRESMCCKVSCLKKRHDGRDWASSQ